jgi:N utilization substance protein A
MIKIGPALLDYAEQLERERSIPKNFILDALKEAMLAAYRRFAGLADTEGYSCKLLEKTGEIGIFQQFRVVDELPEVEEAPEEAAEALPALSAEDSFLVVEAQAPEETLAAIQQAEEGGSSEEEEPAEPVGPKFFMLLQEARRLKADITLDEDVQVEVTPSEFGRIAAQAAKQVIVQRIREAEKVLIAQEFEEKKYTVVPGVVQRVEGRNVVVNIGRNDAILPAKEQVPGEAYRVGNKLRVYVQDLNENARVPQIIVSQGHISMVKEAFELEVPEIEDGLVEIKAIAREAGHRTKVAVHSTDANVDPQGACIGTRGSRIQAIVAELKNEKIDIIRWSEDEAQFISAALAPARIVEVRLDPKQETRRALVLVPDDQLSLAIGREGQNVRLAAKLTGYKLDIKSVSQFQKLREEFAAFQAKKLGAAPAPAETPESPSAPLAEAAESSAPEDSEA